MTAATFFALVTVVYNSDVILKDSVHAVKVVRHAAKHPKKAVTHPVATMKEVK